MIFSLYTLTKFYIVDHLAESSWDLSKLLERQRQDLIVRSSKVFSDLDDRLFQRLCPLPMEKMDFTYWKITRVSLDALLGRDCGKVKELVLKSSSWVGLDLKERFACLAKFGNLSSLHLIEYDFQGFQTESSLKRLEELELQDCRFPSSFDGTVLFSRFPHLKRLKFRTTREPDKDNSFVIPSICPHVESIIMSGSGRSALERSVFSSSFSGLKCLVLKDMDCGGFLEHFPENLEALSLERTRISQSNFSSMLTTCKKLGSLTFIGGSASVEALNSLIKYSTSDVREFLFEGTSPQNEDAKMLVGLYIHLLRSIWSRVNPLKISFRFDLHDLTMTQEFTAPEVDQ